jgi:formate hydrogenlyase subunit 3/multisubunit Na+/H+ antiporter MnhD subunit
MGIAFSLPCILGLLALSPVGVALGHRRSGTVVVYAASFVLSILLLANGGFALLSAEESSSVLPLGLPWIGAHFAIDPLAAAFLVVVNLGGAGASLYALGYGQHEKEPWRVLPFFPLFLAGMNLVVVADDAFTFLVSWEFMSLSSWALVMAHHRDPENRRAGFIYIVMASFGTLALVLAFGLLAGPQGDYAFNFIRIATPEPFTAGLVLLLVLIGAGSKAGVVPLHVWLPLAHPAAPSHVSALMSGVMTKVAVYAFIRIVFDLNGLPEWWWGLLVLVVGAASAVLGVLQALMQHDLKRLLAYHTVENIGIIFIGLGLALAFGAADMAMAAALALTAALFHVFNHSLFKSLLFFGSGAVLSATGERDIEHLGGLIHHMPATALAFLIGCVAISALPPLNGFISEWLTFQAILLSPTLDPWALKLAVPAVGALLALSAALAAACFVKAYGVTFLGRPRTPAAEAAREVDGFSLTAMFALAALCFAAGVLPGFVIDALSPVVRDLVGGRMPVQASQTWFTIVPIAEARSSYNGLLVLVFIAASAGLCALAIHQFASREVRRAPAWDCGAPDPSPMTQYSSASFAEPIRRVFGTLIFHAREHVTMPPPGSTAPARFTVEVHDLIWDSLYAPLANAISVIADRMNALQFLTIRRYLTFVFLALVILLFVVAL